MEFKVCVKFKDHGNIRSQIMGTNGLVWSISGRFGSNLANLGGCLVLIEMKSENTLVLISGVCPIGTLGEIEILGKIVFWQTSKGGPLQT